MTTLHRRAQPVPASRHAGKHGSAVEAAEPDAAGVHAAAPLVQHGMTGGALARGQRQAPMDPATVLALQRTHGNAHVQRLIGARPAAINPSPHLQRFGEKEHRNIGDWATNRAYVTLGSKGYQLTYGELIALAGDLFPSLAYMEKLANRPGSGPQTQEALDYARYIKIGRRNRKDARTWSQLAEDDANQDFPGEERKYNPATYSKATRDAVDAMYYKLATGNASHFVAPVTGDAGKKGHDRPHSAGASYRENHEEALRRAWLAGKRGASPQPALAAEGFGGHFLTDAVSAGHIRAPRLDIVGHWDKRDTGLAKRFKGYMMTQVSEWILANHRKYALAGPGVVYSAVADGIDKALASRPALTLGILVALAVHDYDNKHGLHVLSGRKRAKVYGDRHFGEGDTAKVAIAAVRAGIKEVHQAYQLGAAGKTFAQVKATLLGGGGQYKPESLLPRLDPKANNLPVPRWAVETFEELLADGPMREALALTIRNNLAEIEEVAKSLPEPGRSGILQGFAPLVKQDAIRVLRSIYSFKETPIFDMRNLPAVGIELPTH